ncbi:MAG: MBL fold metallo-hydrolase [Parvibaculum sp.]
MQDTQNTRKAQSSPMVKGHFHAPTNTVTYLIWDAATGRAAIIDPVLDYDSASGKTGTQSADAVLHDVNTEKLTVDWILETHIHADHVSAAHYLKSKLPGAKTAVSERISVVQSTFAPIFAFPYPFAPDGRQFDQLFGDKDTFALGAMEATVLHTPGHTPACVSYLVGDAVFVGDTLFMPDYGTARCDFPGGDAGTLYGSISTLLALPDETRMFLCHDYAPNGRAPAWETTVGIQKNENLHIAGKSKEEFVTLRMARDEKLSMPALILPSIQLNMRAGELPPAEENGTAYLRIPLNFF